MFHQEFFACRRFTPSFHLQHRSNSVPSTQNQRLKMLNKLPPKHCLLLTMLQLYVLKLCCVDLKFNRVIFFLCSVVILHTQIHQVPSLIITAIVTMVTATKESTTTTCIHPTCNLATFLTTKSPCPLIWLLLPLPT